MPFRIGFMGKICENSKMPDGVCQITLFTAVTYLRKQLTAEFGKGFSVQGLCNMRQFYCTFPNCSTLWSDLSWSHYRLLMCVTDEQARSFYTEECVKCAWSVRQLEPQINMMYYQRTNKSNRVSGFFPIPCHSIS